MRNRKWYKWPQGYVTSSSGMDAFPWYVVVRKLAFYPLLVTFLFSLYITAKLGGWHEEAEYIKGLP